MPKVSANGIELYYEDNGPADAPVILLVMGLGTQMIAWPDALIEGLVAKGFRVIHYDNRDVGLSTHLNGAQAPSLLWTMIASRFGLPLNLPYRVRDMAADECFEVAMRSFLGAADEARVSGMAAHAASGSSPRMPAAISAASMSGAALIGRRRW